MRSRERILANLEEVYRGSFNKAREDDNPARMADLDNAYVRDQLMLEILLDIRDLFAVSPAAPAASGKSAIEQLVALKKLTGR